MKELLRVSVYHCTVGFLTYAVRKMSTDSIVAVSVDQLLLLIDHARRYVTPSTAKNDRQDQRQNERYPPVSSDEGRILMDSGCFGTRNRYEGARRNQKVTMARRLLDRELGLGDRGNITKLIFRVCFLVTIVMQSLTEQGVHSVLSCRYHHSLR